MKRAERLAQLPDWPAAMSIDTAAAYCEIPVAVFKRDCPVKPRAIGGHVRYSRRALDRWIDGGREANQGLSEIDEWLESDDRPHPGH